MWGWMTMPKIVARMYVNVRLLTTESGPGTVLSRMVVEPDKKNMLEVLRNGGGKSTLTAIELFSLVPKVGSSKSRMRDLFRPGVGPTYVAYNLEQTGKWAKGFERVYLICCLERRTNEDGIGDVRRVWAFIPAANVGRFETLPLTTDEGFRRYPVAVEDFEKWAKGVPEATCLSDANLSNVEAELSKYGLSPSELGTQLQINYDEGGIENYFSRGTTAESFFEDCLMPVVENNVLGDRDKNWLQEASCALATTAKDRMAEISKLEAYRTYGGRLKEAHVALEADHAARRELSSLKYRADRITQVADKRVSDLIAAIAEANQRREQLTEERKRIDHIDCSVRYWHRDEQYKESTEKATLLREQSDEVCDQLEEVRAELAAIHAAQAYLKFKPLSDTVAALESTIAALQEESGSLGDVARDLQAKAMFAFDEELKEADAALSEATKTLESARTNKAKAHDRVDKTSGEKDRANREVGIAEANQTHASKALERACAAEPPIDALTRIMNTPDLTGHIDLAKARSELEQSSKALDLAVKRLEEAKRDEASARDYAKEQDQIRNQARQDRDLAQRTKERFDRRLLRATEAFERLDHDLRQVAANAVGTRDPEPIGRALTDVGFELSAQHAKAQAQKDLVLSQIEAFERGAERTDPRVLKIMDDLGIKFSSLREIADDRGIDPNTYLVDDPWMADVLFMSKDDAEALGEALPQRNEGDPLIALVATTDDVDKIGLSEASELKICSNVVTEWVTDPKAYRQELQDRLDRIEHDLESIELSEQVLESARNNLAACRAALDDHATLADLKKAADEATSAFNAAEAHLRDSERELSQALRDLEQCVALTERLTAAVSLAQATKAKWVQATEAIETYNTSLDQLDAARQKQSRAEAAFATANRLLAEARTAYTKAVEVYTKRQEHQDTISSKRQEVWSDALTAQQDAQGRDAWTLLSAWRDANDQLRQETEDLGKQIDQKTQELEKNKISLAYARNTLDEACREADLTRDEAREASETLDPTRARRLEDTQADLKERSDEARRRADEAERAEDEARVLFKAATDELRRAGFEAALPKEQCWDIDVSEERERLAFEDVELTHAMDDMRAERETMAGASSSAFMIARELGSHGAYRAYEVPVAGTLDFSEVSGECMLIERSYQDAIATRTRTKEEASILVEAAVNPYQDLDARVRAEDTQRTLLRNLGDVTEYEAAGSLKNLEGAIADCDRLVGLLEEQLQEYEARLGQTAKTCASDIAEAIARLDGIVHDATIVVSAPGAPRRRAEFLELSLQGRPIREIYTKKARVDLVADIEATILPYLRTTIEDTLAPLADDAAMRAVSTRALSLSRLLRIYVGGGTTPAGVTVRHATYTKLETRRHKDWSTLFKRNAMAQSGAETTLVFFVIYLAITKCVRQTEIPQKEDDSRFVILDNPFTKMSDKWAVEFLGRVADHFNCQMVVKTALQEIAAHNVFPYVCSYHEDKRTADGTIVMGHTITGGDDSEFDEREFDVFSTTAEQLNLEF